MAGGKAGGAVQTDKRRIAALENAINRIYSAGQASLWDAMGGGLIYPEQQDLGTAIMDAVEVLVDQSEAEHD